MDYSYLYSLEHRLSPRMDNSPASPVDGFPWYSNFQTLWARNNVMAPPAKPFKRWFEVDETEGSTEQAPAAAPPSTSPQPAADDPTHNHVNTHSPHTTHSNGIHSDSGHDSGSDDGMTSIKERGSSADTSNTHTGSSESGVNGTQDSGHEEPPASSPSPPQPDKPAAPGDQQVAELTELMQRGDTAVVFPEEPVEEEGAAPGQGAGAGQEVKEAEVPTAQHNHAEQKLNNNNNVKGSEVAPAGECPVQCPHCSSNFGDLVTLREHIATQHADVKTPLNSSSCLQCGATFQDKEELDKHITLHCPVTQECKICQKTFANVYRLQRHMISHEESTELRKFKCPECSKAFKFKHHLKEHIRIHSGEKPFECANCGKRFSHSGSYSSHMTSKKCWVGNFPGNKVRKQADTPSIPRQNEVLRPLVPKGDDRNNGGLDAMASSVYATMYQNLVTGVGIDPNTAAQLQYSMAMRNFMPFPGAAGHVINPLLPQLNALNYHQLLMQNKVPTPGSNAEEQDSAKMLQPSPVKMEDKEVGKKEGDEKENEVQKDNSVEEAMDTSDSVSRTDEKEDNGNEEEGLDAVKKVLEIVDATVNQQQKEKDEVDKTQLSKLASELSPSQQNLTLNVLASAASRELQEMNKDSPGQQLRCRYCPEVFSSPIDQHQHERYMCAHNQDIQNGSSRASAGGSPSPLHIHTDYDSKPGSHTPTSTDDHSDDGHSCRVRSILSDEQKRQLEAQYVINPWPTKVDMERLAGDTGLARRVIQVWFQNCRARDRRKGKTIPERPVGMRATEQFTPRRNEPSPRITPSATPYIPRVPKITLSPNLHAAMPSFYAPVTSTPFASTVSFTKPTVHESSPSTPASMQVEPLDLSTKSSDSVPPSDHALNLCTKEPDLPKVEESAIFKYLQRNSMFPSEEPSSPTPVVNTTPAHSHISPRATPERASTHPPTTPASVLSDLLPRTSTPHRSSPAVFPTMVPSPGSLGAEPMVPSPSMASDLTSPAPSSSLDASFNSTFSDQESRKRRKSFKLVGLENEDLSELADDLDDEDSLDKKKRKSWKQHRVDTMDGMYACDQCDKLFNKQSSLARHKYEHSGQRPFPCDTCGKAFKHKHHLTEHKRLHSGEKPFECTKCGKRFSHSGSYSQHMNHRYKYCKPLSLEAGNADNVETASDSGSESQQAPTSTPQVQQPVVAAV